MPIPLVIAALSGGGTLVTHSAGGFIVSSAGAYVAGTYISTATVATLLTTGAGVLAMGAAVATGAATSIIGSAGIFGTTLGATGLTGALMSAGLISSTPIWVPVAVAGTAVAGSGAMGYAAYQLYQMRSKAMATPEGEEAHFTESQARVLQLFLLKFQKNENVQPRENTTKAEDVYQRIEDEYKSDMVPSPRQDGRAYYWQEKRTNPESTRIVRITENRAGDVIELKLAVNENKGVGQSFLSLPASLEEIMKAVRGQVELFRRGK